MTVLFRQSEGGQRFLNVWNHAKSLNTGYALVDMNDTVYGSQAFGYALHDAEATDFQLRFDRDFFSLNYDQIIDSHETLATYDTIIYLIKAALGQNTVISFETPLSGYLIVNIQEPSVNVNAATLAGNLIKTKTTLDQLMWKATTSEYTLNQVKTMLESIELAGVYVEYNFIKGSV